MRLDQPFIRLPIVFDSTRLEAEVSAFEEKAWRPHPEGHPGNSALPLISAGGDPTNDDVHGPMLATPHLDRLPYVRQVLASMRAVWGRTRLMRLDGNADATAHTDTNYYWARHTRVHVPVITGPDVQFMCGDASTHMAAGETWIFDTWRVHNVINPHPTRRIHLVADTVGSAYFWDLVRQGNGRSADTQVSFDPVRSFPFATESINHSSVMPPSEMRELIDLILTSLSSRGSAEERDLTVVIEGLLQDWWAGWARFGDGREAFPLYRRLLNKTEAALSAHMGKLRLTNRVDAVDAIRSLILMPALDDASDRKPRNMKARPTARPRRLDRPTFIVCAPRSGSTLFFETLSQSPALWTVGGESHGIIEGMPELHPASRGFSSNRLTAADATPGIVASLEQRFTRVLRDRDRKAPPGGALGLRMLEKTPKNALRVPFLAAAFPDARFVYLYRDMRDTISSMLDAWRSGKFITYPQLPSWEGLPWSLLLTPGWRELSGKTLAEIVAAQWSAATRYLLDDLEQIPPDQWCVSNYDALLEDPQKEMVRLSTFLELDWDRSVNGPLPLSRTTLTPPDREKWRRNAGDLEIALPLVEEVAARARALFAHQPPAAPTSVIVDLALPGEQKEPGPRTAPAAGREDAPASGEPFRSVFTSSFATVLERLGSSLLVSTYQSGRVIALSAVDGKVNTHFRAFMSPMGIATDGQRLSLGTKNQVWHFRNHPAVAMSLATPADAAWVPSSSRVTGDIRVHELVFAGTELVVVNTRFSCLCRLDSQQSFVPTWRPPFITALKPEDRCHLNGVAVRDGKVAFVTALGESDEARGWRERKGDGGIVMDVASGEVVARGLSMPHSPRWYDGKLWILESGKGRLCVVDPVSGQVQSIAEVPGFARGLAFAGSLAFVGLSQIRESVFSGLPVAGLKERLCGVWIVNIHTGSIVGFVRFDGIVQEIFDVQLLEGVRIPELFEPSDDILDTSFVLSGEG